MGKAATLNGHVLGKYPVAESEGHSHLGRGIAIGGGILGAAAGAFLGYKALTSDSPKNTVNEVQKALSNPKAQTQVIEDPKQYQEQAIKNLQTPYLAKDLTAEEAENAILGWPDFSGYKNSTSKPFKILSAKYLSGNETEKIADFGKLWHIKNAWFVQIELPDGAYTGFFLVEDKNLGKLCYRQLNGADSMNRMVVENKQIYK